MPWNHLRFFIERVVFKLRIGLTELVIRSYSTLLRFKVIGGWKAPPHGGCFHKMYQIEIWRWPFVVVRTSKKAHLTVKIIEFCISLRFWDSHFVQRCSKVWKLCLGGWQHPLPLKKPQRKSLKFIPRGHICFFFKAWSYKLWRVLIELEIRCSSSLFESQSDWE